MYGRILLNVTPPQAYSSPAMTHRAHQAHQCMAPTASAPPHATTSARWPHGRTVGGGGAPDSPRRWPCCRVAALWALLKLSAPPRSRVPRPPPRTRPPPASAPGERWWPRWPWPAPLPARRWPQQSQCRHTGRGVVPSGAASAHLRVRGGGRGVVAVRPQTRRAVPPDARWACGLQRWPLPGRLLRPGCAGHGRSAIVACAAPVRTAVRQPPILLIDRLDQLFYSRVAHYASEGVIRAGCGGPRVALPLYARP
jgi:hypothetical protein